MVPRDKKVLIIVRCGNKSLHTKWVKSNVNYDIVLLPYEDVSFLDGENSILTKVSKGQKWKSIYNYIIDNIDFVANYSHVWFPDDDLDSSAETLSAFFSAAQKESVKLAQPSLTPDSFYSHLITLSFPFSYSRAVSFVEVMAPLFSRDALLDCLWTFNLNESGWGLEEFWFKILSSKPDFNNNQIIIYDCFSIKHTRPVGAQNRGLSKQSKSPVAEKIRIHKYWSLQSKRTIFSINYEHKTHYPFSSSQRKSKHFCKIINKNLIAMSKNQSITFKRRLGGTQGKELSPVSTSYLLTQKFLYIFWAIREKYLNFFGEDKYYK